MIRPHLHYRENSANGVDADEAVRLIKINEVALVNSLDVVFEVLAALGWSAEDAAFTVEYALSGAAKLDN